MANLNPMIYVKVVCDQCDQKYAFDVLPVNNQMPMDVKCPICKADGTAAANLFLARKYMGQDPITSVTNSDTATPTMSTPQPAETVSTAGGVDFFNIPGKLSVPPIPSISVPSAVKYPGVPTLSHGAPPAMRETLNPEEWQRRALEAEIRAEQAQAALKAGLAPQLAASLKEAVVQGLAAQRSELLKAQQDAALEMAALVRRLDDLKVPIQERLHSYEDRIRELEKELAERDEENRELLKLRIEMTRTQLEAERSRSRLNFN